MSDVVILGGGVIGLSLAYDLARHGLRPYVVERGEVGQEASWAGAGIIPASKQVARDQPYDQLAGLSSALHPEWSAQLHEATGIDNGYRPCGGIYLARDPETWHALEMAADDWYGRKLQVNKLDANSLSELEPTLACSLRATGWPQRVLAAYHLPDEAQVRNPWHVKALLRACEQLGVTISLQCEVIGFEVSGGRMTGVRTQQGLISAESFIVCAGAWTRRLLETMGISVRVKPILGQIVLFRGEQVILQRVINDGPRYLVPRDDGRVLVGSTEEDVGFEKRTTESGIDGLKKFCREICPAVADLPIEKTWSGLRPATTDGLPYLGPVPGLSNAFVAAGHYRSGLHLSPGTAVVMSQLIRGEQTLVDLTPFRVGRG